VRHLDLRACLLAVALLVGVEVGIVRSGYLWKRTPNTMFGAFTAVESRVLAPAPPPKLVFFGSSRMRDAVDPRALERELDLGRGDVLNLGITGGTPYEARLFQSRHGRTLAAARVVVVGVENWYWNEGMPRDEVERELATFGDRVGWFERRRQLGDLVGGAWRTVEVGDPLGRFFVSFVKGVKPVAFTEDRMVWRKGSEVREVGPAFIDVEGPLADHMQSLALGPAHEASLRALVQTARGGGARVVLTQLPLRASYCAALDRAYPTVAPYIRARTEAIAAESGAEVIWFDAGSALGIGDDRFYDYGHLTEDGVRQMNREWKRVLGASLVAQ